MRGSVLKQAGLHQIVHADQLNISFVLACAARAQIGSENKFYFIQCQTVYIFICGGVIACRLTSRRLNRTIRQIWLRRRFIDRLYLIIHRDTRRGKI